MLILPAFPEPTTDLAIPGFALGHASDLASKSGVIWIILAIYEASGG